MYSSVCLKFGLLLLLALVNLPYNKCWPSQNDLETIFEWKLLEYGFPTPQDKSRAIANGNLIQENAIPIDVAPYYSPTGLKVFTTIPRFQNGIPYTLATIKGYNNNNKTPILQPYPNYALHNSNGADCDGITSAFRVAITECNEMWVIDSGSIAGVQRCAPQLLLYNLQTDQLMHRYRFNTNVFTPNASLLVTPIAVVHDPPPHGSCQHTMLYIADVTNHGIVVYDHQKQLAWRVENKYMYPEPKFGTHKLAADSFTLMDGILGMTTDKLHLFFHPMASISEYFIPLSFLDNQTIWAQDPGAMPDIAQKLGVRSSECAAEAMDSHANIYCVTFNPVELISWNIFTAYNDRNIRKIPANPHLLEFVSGMKIVYDSYGLEELWMISNRFQKIAAGTQKSNEVNFRILRRRIGDLHGIANPGLPHAPAHYNLHNKLIFNKK